MSRTMYLPDGMQNAPLAAEMIGNQLWCETYQPQYTWLDGEPADAGPGTAIVDRHGFLWVYQYDEDDELVWTRCVYELMLADPDTGRRMMTGPTLTPTWDDDVYWDGPVRYATEADAPGGRIQYKFLYWPGGYKNGSPVGPYVVLDSPTRANGLRP